MLLGKKSVSIFDKNELRNNLNLAFTIAEVLIVLGIIGIVAEMTIPDLINDVNEQHYKVAYKKAYSDISQAMLQAQKDGNLVAYSGNPSSLTGINSNFNVIKQYFKVSKDCPTEALTSDCWTSGEPQRQETAGLAFVDASGMAWKVMRTDGKAYASNILVDINGNSAPNKYGYDRFAFSLGDHITRSAVIGAAPDAVILWDDRLKGTTDPVEMQMCPSYAVHSCLYTGWILGVN